MDAVMSLINQMLQDLDKRRAGETGASVDGNVSSEIRAVASHKRSNPVWKIAAFSLLLVAVVLAWLLLRQNPVLPIKAETMPVATRPLEPVVNLPNLRTDASLAALPSQAPAPPVIPAQAPQPAAIPAPKATMSQPAVVVVPEIAVRSQPTAQPEKAMATGHSSVEKQNKELSPQQRAENEYRKAIGLTQQGRLAEAIDSLQQATKLDPLHLSARQMLVALLVDSKRLEEAELTLQEGLRFSPEQSGFAMMLARLQVSHGDANAALETLHKGLPYASGKADYHALYAALLQRQDKHAEAIEQYQVALRATPNSGVWLMGLGISLQAEKHNKEAEDAFTRAKASGTLSPDLKAFVEERLKQLQ
jgi:MSHA biogenesis protein MshN